jgi:DNA-binding transcriptional LysR family regulator
MNNELNSFNTLNLNLLKALKALLEERSVTKAAEACDVTQSAMSVSLKKLRHHFKNELLIRGQQETFLLTPFAAALKDKVQYAIQQLELVFFFEEYFEPALASNTLVIGMSDYVSFVLLPPLLKALEHLAPNLKIVQVALNNLDDINVFNRLDLDFAIGDFRQAPNILMTTKLFEDFGVIAACKNHPLMQQKTISTKNLMTYPQVFVSLEKGIDENFILNFLRKQGYSPVVNLITPYTLLALQVLPNTHLVTNTVIKLATPFLDSLGLAIRPTPYKLRAYEAKLYWPALYQESKLHQWFRELLKKISQDLVS